jgi:hypothetical protein
MGIRKKQTEAPVVVKKVKAYPISVLLTRTDGTPPIRALILRVNTVGLQIESTQLLFKVGEDVKVSFTIPMLGHDVETLMRVIKTTDSYRDINAAEKKYITELHFKNLSLPHSKQIRDFMIAINQKN